MDVGPLPLATLLRKSIVGGSLACVLWASLLHSQTSGAVCGRTGPREGYLDVGGGERKTRERTKRLTTQCFI